MQLPALTSVPFGSAFNKWSLELIPLLSSERSRSVFWPFGRKDIEIEYRFIAEHLAPMGDIRGNDD